MSPEFLKKIAERLGLKREPIKPGPLSLGGNYLEKGPQAFIGPAGTMKREDIEKSMAEIRRTAAEIKASTMPVILPAGTKIMPTLDIDWEKLKEIEVNKKERDEMKPFQTGHGNAAPGAKAPEKEKERVTIYEAPVYNDEHLATIREALELLGLHYEVSTNRAQVYQPISLAGLWASNQFNIKIQTMKEKEDKPRMINLDGGCPHCGENEFEYNENKLSCAHCEKNPLDEPEKIKNGDKSYNYFDICPICRKAPDFEKHQANYYHDGFYYCYPHYIEVSTEPDPFADQCSFCDSGKPAEQIDIDGKKACEDCKEPTPDPEENMTGYLKRKFSEAAARKLEETIMNVDAFSGSAPEISQDEKGPHIVCDIEGCRDQATHEATFGKQIYKYLCEYHANCYHPKAYRPLEPAENKKLWTEVLGELIEEQDNKKDDAAEALAHSVKLVQELLDVDQEKAKDIINTAANAGLNPMNEKEVFKILADKKITAEAITKTTLGQNMKIISGIIKESDIKEQKKSDLKGLAAYHSETVPENKEKQLDPDYLAYLNDPLQDPRD